MATERAFEVASDPEIGAPDSEMPEEHAGALPSSRAARARPALRVLSTADLARRRERRRARRLIGLSSIVVAGALGLVTAANSLVAADQVRADSLQSQVASAVSANQSLQLQKADLEAPARILSLAERHLDMIQPSSVTYLSPVTDTGPSPNPATPAGGTTGRTGVPKAGATWRASTSAAAKR
jgi:cell division protein FtsL